MTKQHRFLLLLRHPWSEVTILLRHPWRIYNTTDVIFMQLSSMYIITLVQVTWNLYRGIPKPNPDLVPNSGPIPDHFWHFGPDLDQVRNSGPFGRTRTGRTSRYRYLEYDVCRARVGVLTWAHGWPSSCNPSIGLKIRFADGSSVRRTPGRG